MKTEAVQSVLENYDSAIQNAVEDTFTTDLLGKLDAPTLTYIMNALKLQTVSHTRAKSDKGLIEMLAGFIFAHRLEPTLAEAMQRVKALIARMNDRNLIAPSTINRQLDTPLNMRKDYAARMRKTTIQPIGSGVAANFNTALDWSKGEGTSSARQRKENRSNQQGKVSQNDSTSENTCICLHRTERLKGNEDEIHCKNLTVSMGKTSLLQDAELNIYRGHKYGLVGQNGSGKTTLMRLITEKEIEGISPLIQIVHVEQEIPKSNKTPIECILNTDVERLKLLAAEKQLLDSAEPNIDEMRRITHRLSEIEAETAEYRAEHILRGLSFTEEMMRAPTSDLSGGWRMRVALAKALFVKPDILFLDEPTNHLDLHAVLWLEDFLENWKNTLVIVSHNRSFLNAVCREIIHLENKRLVYYKGNYDTFERTRLDNMQQHHRSFAAQEKAKAHMQTFIDRFRCQAARASQVQSRMKALERLNVLAPLMEETRLNFDFPSPASTIDTIIQASEVAFQYSSSSRMLFRNVNLCVTNTSRIGIVGANGAGKSTFLKILSGAIQPTSGHVTVNPKARVGFFTQHHVDSLNLSETPLETLERKFGKGCIEKFRPHLSRFGLRGSLHLQPIYTLSGGQKSRLAFAIMTFREPDLLILDEPTNHLDIDTVNALIEALIQYKGGVIVVSHDEYLLSSVCSELWVTQNGSLLKYDSDFTRYKNHVIRLMEQSN